MEVKLRIIQGTMLTTEVIIHGYVPMVEYLLEAVKKAAKEKDNYCEIR